MKTKEQKACPYCHIDKGSCPQWSQRTIGKCLPYDGYGYPKVYVDPESAQICLDAWDTPTIDINYCPMCGRKLS